MTNRQGIICDETLGERLLVALASLFRLGEIVGEVRANQLFTRRPGDLHSGLVHVGDLAFRADGDQRVHARFDQAPRILRRLLLRGDITRGGEHPQHVAAGVLVHRGVVQHIGLSSLGMPDGQRIVGDETF